MAHNTQATRNEKVLMAMKPNSHKTMWSGRVDGTTYDLWLSTTSAGAVWAVNAIIGETRRHLGTYETRNRAFQAIIADK